MGFNSSFVGDLPPLPAYTLTPREPLFPPVADNVLALILPVVAYWGVSMIFHFIDVYDYFPQYRLHTPAELLKRNHVTRADVVRDVILQQVIQTIAGYSVTYFDGPEYTGREEYDVAVWARRIRIVQSILPGFLGLLGVDSLGLSKSLSNFPALSAALAGGVYPYSWQTLVLENGAEVVTPAFAGWELTLAQFIYSYFIPGLQFLIAILIVDTWQYFWHRAMHLNRWLYGELLCCLPVSHFLTRCSEIPLPSPPSLRALCLWRFVQPPRGRVSAGYCGRRRGVSRHWNDSSPINVVFHNVNHQDCR
jgi:sphinganine C4-monooxygenase